MSNLGRVKSKRGLITYGRLHTSYMRVCVSQNNVQCHVFVHRLVCEAFHGTSPGPNHTVDHIDRNLTNNHESNLRWATKTEQRVNASNVKAIRVVHRNSEEIGIFESIAGACEALHLDKRMIKKYANTGGLYKEYYFTFVSS